MISKTARNKENRIKNAPKYLAAFIRSYCVAFGACQRATGNHSGLMNKINPEIRPAIMVSNSIYMMTSPIWHYITNITIWQKEPIEDEIDRLTQQIEALDTELAGYREAKQDGRLVMLPCGAEEAAYYCGQALECAKDKTGPKVRL